MQADVRVIAATHAPSSPSCSASRLSGPPSFRSFCLIKLPRLAWARKRRHPVGYRLIATDQALFDQRIEPLL